MHREFDIRTDSRLESNIITNDVREKLPDSLQSGVCTVFVQHTTAGIIINEDEERLRRDIERYFSDIAPDEGHEHDELDNNADSHLRSTMIPISETIPVVNGNLNLGRYQDVMLLEFDGPRSRTVSVSAMSPDGTV
jgi:secondary thiamine-phosphate synthase enzyme